MTTSLSSPSRASILTGLFTHTHTLVDNQAPKPDDLVFFPQYLQQNGYRTAFFGKWHMGNQDDMPQPGFDHWEGFRGQGTYYNTVLNINGERVKFDPELYSTDILTDHAIDFVRDNEEGPFFIYLSYKSVHSGFQPSPSRKGMYKDEKRSIRRRSTCRSTEFPDCPARMRTAGRSQDGAGTARAGSPTG